MLQSEEIDDNYFTPMTSSSLSNLFSKESNNNDDQSTLKYIPPKSNSTAKTEESKKSECIFSCTPYAYEWLNNVYVSKGKIGLAIVKILTNGVSNIILYDSNKSTLSCTNIDSSLNVKWNNEKYISFYDNAKKYWGISETPEKLKLMTDILSSYNVNILLSNEDISLYHQKNVESQPTPYIHSKFEAVNQHSKEESDTDTSTSKKTKSLIYHRVTSMGQFMLPPQAVKDTTTDSSDETYDHQKTPRHKFSKKNLKSSKTINDYSIQNISNFPKKPTLELESEYKCDHQFTNKINTQQSVETLHKEPYTPENRIPDNEMQINLSKLSDKIDNILEKVVQKDNFSNEICQKLLNEYENKIKMYEEFILNQGFSLTDVPITKMLAQKSSMSSGDNQTLMFSEDKDSEIEKINNEIIALKNIIKTRDSQIAHLKNEVEYMSDKLNNENKTVHNATLSSSQCTCNNVDMKNMKVVADSSTKRIIKEIMNNVYQSTATSFENDQSYPGSNVKGVVAAIIKKITLQVLNDNDFIKNKV